MMLFVVDAALPPTSAQLPVRPVVRLLVCACRIQPRWSAGHESVSAVPEPSTYAALAGLAA